MRPTPPYPSGPLAVADREAIHFAWLLRMRWASLAGQAITIVAVHYGMRIRLPLGPLLAILGAGTATNFAGELWARRRGRVTETLLASVMALDVLLLTALLYFTGGPLNPFSFVYLVEIALSVVLLKPRSAWLLAGLSLLGSGVLFIDHRALALEGMGHHDHMRIHLWGMWVAFGVTAGFIVTFLLKVTRALAAREAELEAARQLTERSDKLASLATLAAGAAHELATPLSTIAVVAKELERLVDGTELGERVRADVLLVRDQVQRCRAILDGMSADAAASTGEAPAEIALGDLVDEAVSALGSQPTVEREVDPALARVTLRLPVKAVAQALRGVVKNALQASAEGGRVRVVAREADDRVALVVLDEAGGMTPDVLRRAGEPFFTTKPPGQGMGLGLFLTRAIVERLGGRFSLESVGGKGTTVTLELPIAPAVPSKAGSRPAPSTANPAVAPAQAA